MKAIEISRLIRAPIEAVWAALTDPGSLAGWMEDAEVSVNLSPGGTYRFFGGATTGSFTEIRPTRRLAYTWRQQEWDERWKDSLVEWDLRSAPGGTEVRLRHGGFPNDAEQVAHAEGWEVYFLGPMQAWLESDRASIASPST